MRILVFDDNETHRAAACAQLKDHDLTVVDTYDEAQRLLTPQLDYEKASAILKGQFGDFHPHCSDNEAKNAEYFAAQRAANEQATTYPDFDVVLSDLLVPASRQAQGPDGYKHIGTEMPVGIFIGLVAAVRAHAKYVAVFTDSDHHSHPASACFDVFNECETQPTPFSVESSKVLLSNTRNWIGHFDPQNLATEVDIYADLPGDVSPYQREQEWMAEGKVVRAKNWAALLAYLTT